MRRGGISLLLALDLVLYSGTAEFDIVIYIELISR